MTNPPATSVPDGGVAQPEGLDNLTPHPQEEAPQPETPDHPQADGDLTGPGIVGTLLGWALSKRGVMVWRGVLVVVLVGSVVGELALRAALGASASLQDPGTMAVIGGGCMLAGAALSWMLSPVLAGRRQWAIATTQTPLSPADRRSER